MSESMLKYGRTTLDDSTTVRIITVVTMLYLPPTSISVRLPPTLLPIRTFTRTHSNTKTYTTGLLLNGCILRPVFDRWPQWKFTDETYRFAVCVGVFRCCSSAYACDVGDLVVEVEGESEEERS